MTQKRLKSKLMWAALVAQVLSILVLTGVITPAESELANQVIGTALQALTLIGVLNNPTDGESF